MTKDFWSLNMKSIIKQLLEEPDDSPFAPRHREDFGDYLFVVIDHAVIDLAKEVGWYVIHKESGQIINKGVERYMPPVISTSVIIDDGVNKFYADSIQKARDKILGTVEIEKWFTEK